MEEILNECQRLAQEFTAQLRDLRQEVKGELDEDSAEYALVRYMHLVVDGTQDSLITLKDALKEKDLV